MFPKLNGRPYKIFKQDNNKEITLLTADTPLKIYDLGFSGAILVTSTSLLEECNFSSWRGSNIRNMVQFENTQQDLEIDNDENEIPRVSYHNVSPFLSSNLRNELDVVVANSHQVQHQLPPGTTSQWTINPMSIFSIQRDRLNVWIQLSILIRRHHVLEDAAGFYNTYEITLSKLYLWFAGDQGKDRLRKRQ